MAKQQTFGDKQKKQSVERMEFVPQLGKKAKLIPVRFIGIGEGIDDLRPFSVNEFVDALLGQVGDQRGVPP